MGDWSAFCLFAFFSSGLQYIYVTMSVYNILGAVCSPTTFVVFNIYLRLCHFGGWHVKSNYATTALQNMRVAAFLPRDFICGNVTQLSVLEEDTTHVQKLS